MKKQQSIETSPTVLGWYAANFPSSRQGVTAIVEAAHMGLENNPITDIFPDPGQALEFLLQAWRPIYRHTLALIRGQFTAAELSLIIDCHNAHMVTPQIYGSSCLLHNVTDSMALDGTAEKWDVDPDAISGKLKTLTSIQAFCLEIWSTGFWYGSGQDNDRDFEKYIAQLA